MEKKLISPEKVLEFVLQTCGTGNPVLNTAKYKRVRGALPPTSPLTPDQGLI